MDKKKLKEVEQLLVTGLETQGGHHKQFYLFKALELVNPKTFNKMMKRIGKGEVEDGIQ